MLLLLQSSATDWMSGRRSSSASRAVAIVEAGGTEPGSGVAAIDRNCSKSTR